MTEQDAPVGFWQRLLLLLIDRLVTPQFILAVASALFLKWLVDRLLGGAVPDYLREVVAALVGFVTGSMVGASWTFFFGNTKSSDDKSRALADNAAVMRRQMPPTDTPQPVTIEQPADQPVPVTEQA